MIFVFGENVVNVAVLSSEEDDDDDVGRGSGIAASVDIAAADLDVVVVCSGDALLIKFLFVVRKAGSCWYHGSGGDDPRRRPSLVASRKSAVLCIRVYCIRRDCDSCSPSRFLLPPGRWIEPARDDNDEPRRRRRLDDNDDDSVPATPAFLLLLDDDPVANRGVADA